MHYASLALLMKHRPKRFGGGGGPIPRAVIDTVIDKGNELRVQDGG